MAVARDGKVFTLNDEFGVREVLVEADVVDVEVRANDGVDVGRAKVEPGELVENGGYVARRRETGGPREVRSHAGVDEDVTAVGSLNQIAGENHFDGAIRRDGYGGGGKLEEIELFRRGGGWTRCGHELASGTM